MSPDDRERIEGGNVRQEKERAERREVCWGVGAWSRWFASPAKFPRKLGMTGLVGAWGGGLGDPAKTPRMLGMTDVVWGNCETWCS